MKTKVLAFGTFDVLHAGHIHYVTEAKKLGDNLTVIVASDAMVEKLKGKKPVLDEEERLRIIAALKPVDEAILGRSDGKIYESVVAVKPDVIALGYDQKPNDATITQELKKRKLTPRIVRISAFNEHASKSSKIKQIIKHS